MTRLKYLESIARDEKTLILGGNVRISDGGTSGVGGGIIHPVPHNSPTNSTSQSPTLRSIVKYVPLNVLRFTKVK